jgi:NAD-dependent dihydropyrimidine dehydrogenase PreA subunit
MVKILVDNDKCTGCGTCVDVCPVSVYEIRDEKAVPVKTYGCLLCRACEVQCPERAIQIIE